MSGNRQLGLWWRLVSAGLLLACLACLPCLVEPASARDNPADGVALASLPREARATYELIRAGGPFPNAKDGVNFGNYEGMLPKQRRGYYREFTVATPGARNRGARRIVCGGSGGEWANHRPAACWYSGDHYVTFSRIREQP